MKIDILYLCLVAWWSQIGEDGLMQYDNDSMDKIKILFVMVVGSCFGGNIQNHSTFHLQIQLC